MSDRMVELTFPTDLWYSQGDENSFFQWLYSIRGYVSCEGVLRTLYVKFDPNKFDTEGLSELVALFERYHESDIKQLKKIANGKLGSWFSSPNRYWREKIFL